MLRGFRDIGTLFVAVYGDLGRVIGEMGRSVLIVALVFVAESIAREILQGVIGTEVGRALAFALVNVAGLYLTTPYLIALYSFIVTGAVVPDPEALRGTGGATVFFAWAAILAFLPTGFALVAPLFPAPGTDPETLAPEQLTLMLALLVPMVAFWIFTMRAITLLPGLSVNPAGTTLRSTLADTAGHFWFIVGATLIVVAPPVLISYALLQLAEGSWLAWPLATAMALLDSFLNIAVASRLYQRLGTP